MKIVLNGQSFDISECKSLTVDALLSLNDFEVKKVAVAINGDFVSRAKYESVEIFENDKVEVLSAVQGG